MQKSPAVLLMKNVSEFSVKKEKEKKENGPMTQK